MSRSRFGLLAAGVLTIALTGCARGGYSAEDFVGTFADGEGETITLLADGTGTMTGVEADTPESVGTWELVESDQAADFIMFAYDDPAGLMGGNQIWIASADRLYLLPDGPDGSQRHEFERA